MPSGPARRSARGAGEAWLVFPEAGGAKLIGGVVAAALALLLDRADTDADPPTGPQPAHSE